MQTILGLNRVSLIVILVMIMSVNSCEIEPETEWCVSCIGGVILWKQRCFDSVNEAEVEKRRREANYDVTCTVYQD